MDPQPSASSEGEERRRLPSRSTRGKRLTELEGIDKDVDEEFWKLNMFAEDEGDNEFETTEQILEEEQDYEDSDIDDYTSDEEGEQQRAQNIEKKIAKQERETKKRKNVYKDESKPKKKKSDKTSSSTIEKEEKEEKLPKTPKSKPIIPVEMKRSSRKSTVKATEAVDEKIKAKTSKAKTPKAPKEVKKFTQEELLEEAEITKEENKKSLLKLRQTEEDVKKKARDSKSKMINPYEPRVKYTSKMGTNLIEFINHDIPKEINQKMPDEEIKRFDIPKEEKQVKCVITGLPAKYFDPLTQKPYANVEAFKKLRENLKKEQHIN